MATINQKINILNQVETQLLLHDDTWSIEKLSELRRLLLEEHYGDGMTDEASNTNNYSVQKAQKIRL